MIDMKNPISISDAESVVMKVLWRRHPMAADEIIAALVGQQDWQESTIKTLLNRLLKKGALVAKQEGKRYMYSPLLQEDAWQLSEGEGMLTRLFDGRVAPLVAHFGKHRKLSAADIAELKKLVQELDDDR